MPWKNKAYPVNDWKSEIPKEEICHHCGRNQFSHGRPKDSKTSIPFSLCEEELLILKRKELLKDIHALDRQLPMLDRKITYRLRELASRARAIEDLGQSIKFQPARRVPED